MSCIPKILELLGDKKYLAIPTNNRVVVETGGHYKGYDFLVTFNSMGFRCGYVAIDHTHPLYNKDLEGLINVHGDVTFFDKSHIPTKLLKNSCDDKWIGFDCAQAGDLMDLEESKEFFEHDPEEIKSIEAFKKINDDRKSRMSLPFPELLLERSEMFHDKKRDKEYVISECRRIIEQLIKHERV